MAADGSGRTTVGPFGFNFDPAWSPDGQRIAWVKWGAGESRYAEVYVMAADGSTPIRLTNDTTQDGHPSWSPDGQRIAFWSRRDGNPEIYVMNADGSAPTRLTDDPATDYQPSWAPDGRQIAFTSTRDGNAEVYVMNADGSAPTRLTNDPAFDTNPSWSPDGRRIAFGTDRDGNGEIYVMGSDGSAPTRLTNNPAADGQPSWSPTGLIAFSSTRDGTSQIYVMGDDGSGQTQLTNEPTHSSNSPSWGPWLDRTPPQLVLPSDFGVPPERWFGALVGYAGLVSGTDDFDPAPDVVCTPPTPSIFPIGTTQVQCTATDKAGNTTTGAFSVTVRGQYEELAFDVENLEATIASRSRDGLSTDRLEEALTKLQAAREEFGRTPTDRLAALGDLQGAIENLYAAQDEGEISASGFSVIARRFADNSRLTADQAIAEAKARGGNAEAIADAEAALDKGDEKRAASEFADAVAQYRKACDTATGA
jgi:dipeptidyl aminopeptidase/acylaminoacyl peptidase